MSETLFELEPTPAEDHVDDWCQPRPDDSAPTCCRYCQTATTAAGIITRGHGPDSPDCARLLSWGQP